MFKEMSDKELLDFCEDNFCDYAVCQALGCEDNCKEEDCPLFQLFERFKKMEVVFCKDCKHFMFSDCYGECKKNYLSSLLRPNDYCSRGVRKE